MRHFKSVIIFSILFTMLFPYSLLAQTQEYKIPENSVSYLAQANTTQQPFMTATEENTALTSADRKEFEPQFMAADEEQVIIEIIPEAEPAPAPARIEVKQKQPAVNKTAKSEVRVKITASTIEPAPVKPATQPVTIQETEPQHEIQLFTRALNKMQQNRAHRQAEAERLGIVLPSQGGDMAAVSPSLSKIQQTLKNIMAR